MSSSWSDEEAGKAFQEEGLVNAKAPGNERAVKV